MSTIRQDNNIIHPCSINDECLLGMKCQFNDDFIKYAFGELYPSLSTLQIDYNISYLRYKPQTSCVVVYRISVLENNYTNDYYIFSKSYLEEDYNIAKEKSVLNTDFSASARKISITFDDFFTIVYTMKADKNIYGLSTVMDPRKLRRILYDNYSSFSKEKWRLSHKKIKYNPIRFKPEKRVLLKASTIASHLSSEITKNVDVYIKCYSDDRVLKVFDLMKLLYLHHSHQGIIIPQPIYLDVDKLFYISEGVEGKPLTDLLTKNESLEYIDKVAEKLSLLHKIKIENNFIKQNDIIIENALSTCNAISDLLPELKGRCSDIYNKLKQLSINIGKDNSYLVHGDFYHDQIIVNDDVYYILDFDRFYLGESLIDVANFCAHLIYLKIMKKLDDETILINGFVNSYKKYSKIDIQENRLKLWIAFCLFQLTVKPFRNYQKNWKSYVFKIIKTVEEL